MAPIIFDRVSTCSLYLHAGSTHDPSHGEPHAEPSPEFLANEESQDASRESSQVVYADDDSLESAAWISESGAPIFVAYNA